MVAAGYCPRFLLLSLKFSFQICFFVIARSIFASMNPWPSHAPGHPAGWVSRKQRCPCGHLIAQNRSVCANLCLWLGYSTCKCIPSVNLTFMRSWFCLISGCCFLLFKMLYGQLQLKMNFWIFHKEVKEHYAASSTEVNFLCCEVNTSPFSFLTFLVTQPTKLLHPALELV